jgi:hypothetical protein
VVVQQHVQQQQQQFMQQQQPMQQQPMQQPQSVVHATPAAPSPSAPAAFNPAAGATSPLAEFCAFPATASLAYQNCLSVPLNKGHRNDSTFLMFRAGAAQKLGKFVQALGDLGVEEPSDLADVTDAELASAGLKPFHINRLRRQVPVAGAGVAQPPAGVSRPASPAAGKSRPASPTRPGGGAE